MAGEARKAAERVMAEIREKAMVLDLANEWQINEAKAIEVIEKELAATIEQCAQIADAAADEENATMLGLRKNGLGEATVGAEKSVKLCKSVAAAIRSIAQQGEE